MLPLVARLRCLIQAIFMALISLFFMLPNATPAAAQGYGATAATSTLVYSSGCYLWIEGSGFAPGSSLSITLQNGSSNTRTATADASGTFAYLFAFNSNDSDGTQTITATGVNPGGGTHTATIQFKILKKCVNADWWNQGNSSKPPPPHPTDKDEFPPFGPTLAGPSATQNEVEAEASSEVVSTILAGGFEPGVEATATNVERVMGSFPAVDLAPTPTSLGITLPLAGTLAVAAAVFWKLGRKAEIA